MIEAEVSEGANAAIVRHVQEMEALDQGLRNIVMSMAREQNPAMFHEIKKLEGLGAALKTVLVTAGGSMTIELLIEADDGWFKICNFHNEMFSTN